MSLAEITRNCFQSGVSPAKWVNLCKLFMSKNRTLHGLEGYESALSNSVLMLCGSYPGDPDLRSYLKHAIHEGIISVSVFVATFVQAARSPELHNAATLDMICRVALDAHYSTGSLPMGSIVSYSDSPIKVLATVQDGLALLRTTHSLPLSNNHQLTSSASELVILLLSCVTDISQISTAQAMVYFADANEMLQNLRLSDNAKQVLETFVVSLSLLIGDDAKIAREAQMMEQLALSKGDSLGTNFGTDIVTCSLILHHIVSRRADEYGAGSGLDPVVLLVGTFRWSSWPPEVYYSQMLLSAMTCLSQSILSGIVNVSSIWRAFVLGRLPDLLSCFEKAIKSDNSSNVDWRSAFQIAIASVFRHSDVLATCNASQTGSEASTEEMESSRSFTTEFLRQCIAHDLVDTSFAMSLDSGVSNSDTSRLQLESQEQAMDMAVYFESKLTPDTSLQDIQVLIDRIWRDPGSHSAFAKAIRTRFIFLAGDLDVESLSHLCKVLYLYDIPLEIASLHVRIADLIFYALLFLEEFDCEAVGDPQTAVSHLGDVVLFVQSTLARFSATKQQDFSYDGKTLSSIYLRSTAAVHTVESLNEVEASAFISWSKALFDSSSEGIEDTILRSTQPKTLLHISATLFSQAIWASSEHKIDNDILNNGVSYFLGPLLNWTLVGVIQVLVREIQQKGFSASIHLEVFQTLVLSPSCPRPVLSLCSPSILQLLQDRRRFGSNEHAKFDSTSVRRVAMQSLGTNLGANSQSPLGRGPQAACQDQPRQEIREAVTRARSGRAPSLNIQHCLLFTPPTKFIQALWSELGVAASLGDIETCRRIATFTLTMPRSSSTPPLLPIFVNLAFPALIANLDHQQPPEQATNAELLVTVASSVLMAALHFEWASRSVYGEQRYILGQSSGAMARKMARDLRAAKNSATSSMIMERLAATPLFVANFPELMSDT